MKIITLFTLSLVIFGPCLLHSESMPVRPNILWLVVEDQSKHYGFNGEKLVRTPVIDALANQGGCFYQRFGYRSGMFDCAICFNHRYVSD